MFSVADCDSDVLRFIWIRNIMEDLQDIQVLQFTKVVFGVSSPFLLSNIMSSKITANN